MKAIHLIAKKLWGKLSAQMPNSKQAQQICLTIHKGENYKLLLTPKPITLGKSSFEIETRIGRNHLKEETIHALHEHTTSGTVTYCSPSPAQIEGKWYEAYYRIKQHFEPLRE